MKILMISKALTVGTYHGKLKEMASLGIDSTVVVPSNWPGLPVEIVEGRGYNVLPIRCFLPGRYHLHFYPRGFETIEADLIHIDEEPWSFATYQVMRLCVRRRKPAIFFTWQNIKKNYPQPFKHFQEFAFKNAAAAIAGTPVARSVLAAKGFSKRTAIIPQFGVDPDIFCRQDSTSIKEKMGYAGLFVIGFIGRFVEAKGIADLLRALPLLPERCVLAFVGTGPYKAAAHEMCRELGIVPRVRWIPAISSMEVPQYMNLFDALVLPSRTTASWKEQFGRVLIEAMACQTPVVGSNSGEIPSVIGNAGLIFPEGDFQDLASQLRQLFENEQLRRQLGEQGRARVLAHYTHRQIARETASFYRSLVGSGQAGYGRVSQNIPLEAKPASCV